MTSLWIILLCVLGGLLLCCIATGVLFHACITRPKREPDNFDNSTFFGEYKPLMYAGIEWFSGQKTEDVSILSYDGLRLCAKLLPCENARGSILLMHGYRGAGIHDFSCALRFFHELGLNILLPDERASGKSEGKYVCFGVRERYDCLDWARWLAVRYGSALPIVLDGISMGATTVLMAAGLGLPENVRFIIADCGFSSPDAIITHVLKSWMHLPKFPFVYLGSLYARLLAGFGFREASTLDAMRSNHIPILFAHGKADTFVPYSMTQAAYDACVAEKALLLVDGAGHGMSYLIERQRYEALVLSFFEKYAGIAP